MKLVYLGAISTSLVVIVGIAIVVPAFFFTPVEEEKKIRVLVQFEISEDINLPSWCQKLDEKLSKVQLKSVIFLSGQLAESHPECVLLIKGVDIGSQGYYYQSIPQIDDYLEQLSEIQKGKDSIDSFGVDSKLFKAPYGETDQNIYSLLSRSGIYADFSYQKQYNLYINGQFLRFDLESLQDPQELTKIDNFQIASFSFDNSESVETIFEEISEIKQYPVQFVNPSDLFGQSLTVRT